MAQWNVSIAALKLVFLLLFHSVSFHADKSDSTPCDSKSITFTWIFSCYGKGHFPLTKIKVLYFFSAVSYVRICRIRFGGQQHYKHRIASTLLSIRTLTVGCHMKEPECFLYLCVNKYTFIRAIPIVFVTIQQFLCEFLSLYFYDIQRQVKLYNVFQTIWKQISQLFAAGEKKIFNLFVHSWMLLLKW